MTRNGLAIALLAAGEARRFGGGKLDAWVGGKRLGRYALEAALALDAGRPVIVVGPKAPQFAQEAESEGLATLALNRTPEGGLSGSVAVAAGLAASGESSALLLLLADMPLTGQETLAALARAGLAGRPAAVLHEGKRAGIPACFPRDWFGRLEQLDGDRGAGPLLRTAPDLTLVPTAPGELSDIDTAEDLAGLEAVIEAGRNGS